MSRCLTRSLAALCIGLVGASQALALTPSELFAKVAPSVWRVRTYDKEGLPLSTGSAVVVAPDTLVTNCHVLRKAARVAVTHDANNVPATLALWDTERDVCQLQARGLGAPTVPLGETGRVVVGQSVYALGTPEGLELTLSAGLVSSLRKNAAQQLVAIQTSAPISHGSSGGGLFDEQGRLIGITTAMIAGNNAQNLNFAVPVDFVRELPQRHQAALERSKSAPPQAPAAEAAPLAPATPAAPPAPSAPPVAVAPPAPVAPTTTALTLSDHVPYLNDARDAELKARYLPAAPPKACAISENGHFGCSWGYKTKDPSAPTDPQQRALQACSRTAGTACVIYVVDNLVVFVPPSRAMTMIVSAPVPARPPAPPPVAALPAPKIRNSSGAPIWHGWVEQNGRRVPMAQGVIRLARAPFRLLFDVDAKSGIWLGGSQSEQLFDDFRRQPQRLGLFQPTAVGAEIGDGSDRWLSLAEPKIELATTPGRYLDDDLGFWGTAMHWVNDESARHFNAVTKVDGKVVMVREINQLLLARRVYRRGESSSDAQAITAFTGPRIYLVLASPQPGDGAPVFTDPLLLTLEF